MQPMNDDELNRILHSWQAPPAPPALETSVMNAARRPGWMRWLLTGSIRVPVPVLAALLLILVWLSGYRTVKDVKPPSTVTLADFEPVQQLQPRIIRSSYGEN